MNVIHRLKVVRILLLLSLMLLTLPALAQDISGIWAVRFHEDQLERVPGPMVGDYLGLPITDAARTWADSWNASRVTLLEHQCQVHVSPYIFRGPINLHVWQERDPESQRLIAIRQYIRNYEQFRTIWMDGRPHPPDFAPHTWMGFSTGKYVAGMLMVETTHIKQGWLRRNGLPESDRATLVEYFIRHGENMTHVSIVTDPAYLTEPLIKSEDFVEDQNFQGNLSTPCTYVEEVIDRDPAEVPFYLPGQNPYLKEFPDEFGIPEEAARGGAQTMYPEYRLKMEADAKKK